MMEKQTLKEIIREQEEVINKKDRGIRREIAPQFKRLADLPHIVVIAGIRRSGKSTLLCQIMDALGKKAYYFNFEDERMINFEVSDFNRLYEAFVELQGERNAFFFDEIQNVAGWERFVRRMHDDGFKFFITGSNASLLSRELGTKLTGRHIPATLYPFSFREYLDFRGVSWKKDDLFYTKKRAGLKKHFNQYLQEGGMPEYLKYKAPEQLKKVYDDILYRDIIVRYDLKESKSLRELALYFVSNIAAPVSYNKLKSFLQLGSINTVKSYLDYLENSFLFFSVKRYAHSLKQQAVSPKKIYCIDGGLANHIAFAFSENKGKFLENLVFLELLRRGKEIYYYKTKNDFEVDFAVKEGKTIKELIQVSWNLKNADAREREVRALFEAMKELRLKKAMILTDDSEETINLGINVINVIPAYKWLLED